MSRVRNCVWLVLACCLVLLGTARRVGSAFSGCQTLPRSSSRGRSPPAMLLVPSSFRSSNSVIRLLLSHHRYKTRPLTWVSSLRGSIPSDMDEMTTAATRNQTSPNVAMSSITSTQQLTEQRLHVQRAKKQARDRSFQRQHERNLQLKRLLHTSTASTSNDTNLNSTVFVPPPLYAVRVSVCEELREELHLNGREKRGRVFVPVDTDGCTTLKGLKQELHSFFRCLRKSTYVLQATLPQIAPDGSLVSPSTEEDNVTCWTVDSDEDVVQTFAAARRFFETQQQENTPLKRPSVVLHVTRDPNAPPPPPPPSYLNDLPNPETSESMTMLSFYAFPPDGIVDPYKFSVMLKKMWKPFHALGRVYVAQEGVNAQMSVPTNVLSNFIECCRSIPELGEYMENGINVDPKPLRMDEFAVVGVPVNGKPAPPFRNLHVRVRGQVLADGLDEPLDWQQAGYDMPPMEWHARLKEAKEKRDKEVDHDEDIPLILDCRNAYETDVGRFDGAEPLDTENFRESWDVLKTRLADTPKDAPIMTYCTGGIRCVKVGAYLTQQLGFTNVSRLAGGIIAYDRTIHEKAADEEPMFKGTNFVFDGRLARPITEDSLGTCFTCGEETSLVSNCRNDNCHKRIIQCDNCRESFDGTCSPACKHRVENGFMMPTKIMSQTELTLVTSESDELRTFETIDDYSVGHSSPVPSLYHEMELNTRHFLPSGSHMISGASQGKLLTQLASLSREGRILELGTFTGYATACLLEGAANAAEITEQSGIVGKREGGPFVMTMERDDRARDVAVAHLGCMCEHGTGEAAAEAACALRSLGQNVPETEGDIKSLSFQGVAGCELLRVTDALATLEEMAQGKGNIHPAPFDLVFVDADKTRLLEYTDACLGSDRILKKGGLIVVDNVLWKGLVLEAASGQFSSRRDHDDDTSFDERKNRRARKLATKMHFFNKEIVKDQRAEVVVLPFRDGLSVIRKR